MNRRAIGRNRLSENALFLSEPETLPATPAKLFERRLLLMVRFPAFQMPPPSKLAELPDSVLPATVRMPPLKMPPPSWAELP